MAEQTSAETAPLPPPIYPPPWPSRAAGPDLTVQIQACFWYAGLPWWRRWTTRPPRGWRTRR
jgi:hypothetical protein